MEQGKKADGLILFLKTIRCLRIFSLVVTALCHVPGVRVLASGRMQLWV